jgi:hypothetical protein
MLDLGVELGERDDASCKDPHTRIKPLALALASGYGRHKTVASFNRTENCVRCRWRMVVTRGRYKFALEGGSVNRRF